MTYLVRLLEFGLQDFKDLDARSSALIIVDMQRFFVSPDYPFGKFIAQLLSPEASQFYYDRVNSTVIPNTQRLLSAFRNHSSQIVYTEFGSVSDDGRDLAAWARRENELAKTMIGTKAYPQISDPSCRTDDTVAPNPEDLVIHKTTSGIVSSSKLDHILQTIGIETVFVTGVVTDVCVTQIARELSDRSFKTIIVEDATACSDEARHNSALETFSITFGDVVSTEGVETWLGSQQS